VFVKDPVFGNIALTELEAKIIDTEEMQRLRHIKQTGFAYLVYPGAMHSRFEHSLGTMYISKEVAKGIGLEDEEAELLALAGLLHDIGHGPFSHTSDNLLKKYLNTNHEEIGKKIIREGRIGEIIEKYGFSKEEVIEKLSGKSKGELVTASLGSDRLDYLLRDAHYTGAAYGVIDYQQIKSKITIYKNKLAIYEQGIAPAESLLLARYFMFTTVYYHHAVSIASQMFEKAADLALANGELEPEAYARMNDIEAFWNILHSKVSSGLAKRLLNRRLFKRIVYKDIKKGKTNREEIEERLINKAKLKYDEFIVFESKMMFIKEEGTPVLNRYKKKIGTIESLSSIVKTLKENEVTRFIIASDRKNKRKILEAIKGQ